MGIVPAERAAPAPRPGRSYDRAADNRLQTVHVAMVLPDFVTLAIYGIVFRSWPELKSAPLAAA
jgi:hypothetical protein